MKNKITILQIARDDIAEIYFYISQDSKKAALSAIDRIIDKIDTLAEFPLIGKIIQDNELAKQGYRMITIDKYIIFYKIIKDEIVIYRVLHEARNYPKILH